MAKLDPTPYWVLRPNEQLAKCVSHPEAAATLVAALGIGSAVKSPNGFRLWHEGHERIRASDNRAAAAQTMLRRLGLVYPG
jgi:hypothetical protein